VKRREPPAPASTDRAPDWLTLFRYAEWADETEQPPPWWSSGDGPHSAARWRGIQARRRWSDAGKAWLEERGRRRDWFALVHPESARNLGMRVPSDARVQTYTREANT